MNRLAVFELDVNDVKLTIYKYTANGFFTIDQQIVEPVKIVQDMERDGYIKPARIQEVINILKQFRKIVDNAKIENHICYTTPEIANARNQIAFLDEVYKTVSLYFKVLTAEEQISAMHNAIMYSFSMTRGLAFLVGDYSTEIIKFNRRIVTNSVSLPYGSMNLLEKVTDLAPSDRMDKVVEVVTSELKKLPWLYELEEDCEFIGAGEAVEALGKLSRKSSRYPLDLAHNYEITNSSFQNVYNLIRGLDLDKAKKLKGISEKRADVIAIGFAIIKALFNECIRANLKVSTNGVMYGIVAKNLLGQTSEKPLIDILGYSLSSINEFYSLGVNIDNNYNLAVILYKQLKVLHKLSRPYVKVLRIAASMCMAGKRISFGSYFKNNFPVILNSDIYGVSQKDILLASFVAASQNVDDFSLTEWIKYKDIVSDEDLDAVKKLAIIIKLATMLNITGSNAVKDIACDVLGDTVILKTEVEHDASLEISQAMSVCGDFKKVYGKNLQVL
ncbi:MAG: hypothetical protein E7374_03055 [Clostridiales bacterium]|nr:hypothetical protein [Clostridiales bacterium]